ncbi:MAG: Tfx family DNA-binding protein [Methanothrix sp.]|nr:Tfx family DNA-binding protein [Methanothrix sp.]
MPETIDDDSLDSFLTQRQIKVLQMRLSGQSQQEVADSLGTTRSNISILEKRAHQNIARAERTLQQWMMLRAPISLQAEAGTDVFELPKMIFAAADEKHMRLPITSLDIVVQLRRKAPRLFKKRSLEKDARIFVTEEGEVLVEGLEER